MIFSALYLTDFNSTHHQHTLQICSLTSLAQDIQFHEKPFIRDCCNHKARGAVSWSAHISGCKIRNLIGTLFQGTFLKGTLRSEGNHMLKYRKQEANF